MNRNATRTQSPRRRIGPLACALVLVSPAAAAALEVVDEQGAPVAQARVEVGWQGDSSPLARGTPYRAVAVTDASGRAPVAIPAVPGVALLVDHPHFAPALVVLADGEVPRRVTLARGRVLRGRVTLGEGEGRLPARQGRVCARGGVPFPGGERPVRRCAALVEGGGFELAGLPPGALTLQVTAAGGLPRELAVGEGVADLPVALRPGLPISGRVVNRAGMGVGGAVLRWPGGQLEADETGAFAAAVEEVPVELTVTAPGHEAAAVAVREAGPLTVVLARGGGVRAALLGEQGPYTGEVSLGIEAVGGGPADRKLHIRTRQVEGGWLQAALPADGAYALRVRVPGYRELRLGPFSVVPGAELELGTVILERGAGVRGTLRDGRTGEAVAGALVEALPTGAAGLLAVRERASRGTVSDAQGEFALGGLPLGRYLVRVQRMGLAPLYTLVDVAQPRLAELGTLTLRAGVTLAGAVRGRHGDPRGGLEVSLWDPAREFLKPLASATTDGDGRFTLPQVSPGRYRLEVGGKRVLWAQLVEVSPDVPQEMAIALPGTRVRGVVRRGGVLVGGGSVTLTARLDPARQLPKLALTTPEGQLSYGGVGWHAVAAVGPDGVFTVEDVPPGLVEASFSSPAGQAARILQVPDREEVDLALEVGGLALSGWIVSPSGAPLPAEVAAWGDDGLLLAFATCAEDGSFRLAHLPPGRMTLVASATGFDPLAVPVQLQEDLSLGRVALPRASRAAVRVRLHREDGTPLEGVPVVLVHLATGERTPRMLLGGELEFPQLRAGSYLVAWAEPLAGAGAVGPVPVGEGGTATVSPPLQTGSSLLLTCPALRCAGGAVETLVVESAAGHDLAPLLSGVSLGLHVSGAGELALGRLAPGRYRIVLGVRDQRWERQVEVRAGETTVTFF